MRQRLFTSGQELTTREGEPLPFSLLLDGWAARYKLLANGRRQVTGIILPGDFLDLQRLAGTPTPNGIVALLPCQILVSDCETIAMLEERAPRLASQLWLDGMLDHAMLQEWLVAMGRRSAVGRMAHLLCELYVRHAVVARTEGSAFRVPLTQTDLADVLGLSIVHVNRTLRTLRRENVMAWNSQIVSILDWGRLRELAEFDPSYLGFGKLSEFHDLFSPAPVASL